MKFGARNQLSGKVSSIKKGKIMCEVEVSVGDKAVMSSVMTMDSLKELKLKKGDKVRVIVKAVNVLLARD